MTGADNEYNLSVDKAHTLPAVTCQHVRARAPKHVKLKAAWKGKVFAAGRVVRRTRHRHPAPAPGARTLSRPGLAAASLTSRASTPTPTTACSPARRSRRGACPCAPSAPQPAAPALVCPCAAAARACSEKEAAAAPCRARPSAARVRAAGGGQGRKGRDRRQPDHIHRRPGLSLQGAQRQHRDLRRRPLPQRCRPAANAALGMCCGANFRASRCRIAELWLCSSEMLFPAVHSRSSLCRRTAPQRCRWTRACCSPSKRGV